MSNRNWSAAFAAAALLLTGCERAEPAHPALWLVDGPHGERAWLFGTIHALPRKVAWQSPAITAALEQSDRLVLEIADVGNTARAGALFARLGSSADQLPLAQRLTPAERPALARLIARHHLSPHQFDGLETWAAALAINQVEMSDNGTSADNGMERQLLKRAKGKPVEELEGLEGQLGMFDRLPEAEQQVMLNESMAGAADTAQTVKQEDELRRAWQNGDEHALAAMDGQGLLADRELRAAILTNRNQAWLIRLKAMMARGQRPFVAVGALHMVGPDGLAAQLRHSGFRVVRLQ